LASRHGLEAVNGFDEESDGFGWGAGGAGVVSDGCRVGVVGAGVACVARELADLLALRDD
jgi:hypothetical protein